MLPKSNTNSHCIRYISINIDVANVWEMLRKKLFQLCLLTICQLSSCSLKATNPLVNQRRIIDKINMYSYKKDNKRHKTLIVAPPIC